MKFLPIHLFILSFVFPSWAQNACVAPAGTEIPLQNAREFLDPLRNVEFERDEYETNEEYQARLKVETARLNLDRFVTLKGTYRGLYDHYNIDLEELYITELAFNMLPTEPSDDELPDEYLPALKPVVCSPKSGPLFELVPASDMELNHGQETEA